MATADKLTENYLTCIICSEVFNNPATLQCDHTFCRPCLLKYTITQPEAIQAKSIPCPVCRQMTRVTSPDASVDEWVNQIKASRLIQGLLDDFGQGSSKTDRIFCDACGSHESDDTSRATARCQQCEKSLCDTCVSRHRRFPDTKDHTISDIASDKQRIEKNAFSCVEHEDENVKLFCKDCKKAICHICCCLSHRQCKGVVTIDSMMPYVISSLGGRREKLANQIQESSVALSQQKCQIERILETSNNTEQQIKVVTQYLTDRLKQNERVLLDQLACTKNEQVGGIKTFIKSEELKHQSHQQQYGNIDQAIKSGCKRDMFVMYESCNDAADNKAEEQEDTPAVGRIRFTHDMMKLQKAVDDIQIGEIVVYYDLTDLRTYAVLHCTIDCKMEGDMENPHIFDVTVLNLLDGEAVVTIDEKNNCLKAFYNLKSGSFKKMLELPGRPCQIAKQDDTTIAISCGGQVLIVNCIPYPVVVSTIDTANSHYGLAYKNSSLLLGGTCMKTCSVEMINLSGNVLKSITTDVVKNPDYIHITKDENVIISQGSNHSYASVTSEGDILYTHTFEGGNAPHGITTSKSGDVILVDRAMNVVKHMTNSGRFVRDVVTEEHELVSPRGLYLDEYQLLYVTSGRFVKVFKFKI